MPCEYIHGAPAIVPRGLETGSGSLPVHSAHFCASKALRVVAEWSRESKKLASTGLARMHGFMVEHGPFSIAHAAVSGSRIRERRDDCHECQEPHFISAARA
jgi:hypothetical protein